MSAADGWTGSGIVERLFLFPAGGATGCDVDEVVAVAGIGLEGDRYGRGARPGTFRRGCPVTLIEGEWLDAIIAGRGLRLAAGEHRRNIVTRGLRHADLPGHSLRVGETLLRYRGPRPPCRHLEALTEPGMRAALGRRAGICVDVVAGGVIRRGDRITLADPTLIADPGAD